MPCTARAMRHRSRSPVSLLTAAVVLVLGCGSDNQGTGDESRAQGNGGSGSGGSGTANAGGTSGTSGAQGSGAEQGAGQSGNDRGGDASEGDAGAGDADSSASGPDVNADASDTGSGGVSSGGESGSNGVDEGGIVDAGTDDEDDENEGGVEQGGGTADDRSCADLEPTCGSSGNQDCCSSAIVTGGTFFRGNDPNYPATLSDFRLDRYEVTVGRFRKFLSAYSQNMIAAGSGRNPNDASDPGWDTAWNAMLPVDDSALRTAISCSLTWTSTTGPNENHPMNCVNWYEANAFCTWDGGRLPSEAEWNYAAAGGSEQRTYPWGASEPDCSYANYSGAGPPDYYCVWVPGPNAISEVGSLSPKGDGKWGQADLAGNLEEWVLDWYANPYGQVPCVDCANTSGAPPWCSYPDAPWCNDPALYRVMRGGDLAVNESGLLTSYRELTFPDTRNNITGFRCARSALGDAP